METKYWIALGLLVSAALCKFYVWWNYERMVTQVVATFEIDEQGKWNRVDEKPDGPSEE